jgi:hypothetical protein
MQGEAVDEDEWLARARDLMLEDHETNPTRRASRATMGQESGGDPKKSDRKQPIFGGQHMRKFSLILAALAFASVAGGSIAGFCRTSELHPERCF